MLQFRSFQIGPIQRLLEKSGQSSKFFKFWDIIQGRRGTVRCVRKSMSKKRNGTNSQRKFIVDYRNTLQNLPDGPRKVIRTIGIAFWWIILFLQEYRRKCLEWNTPLEPVIVCLPLSPAFRSNNIRSRRFSSLNVFSCSRMKRSNRVWVMFSLAT